MTASRQTHTVNLQGAHNSPNDLFLSQPEGEVTVVNCQKCGLSNALRMHAQLYTYTGTFRRFTSLSVVDKSSN